jgi:apolipoprotein N-acyltransferase
MRLSPALATIAAACERAGSYVRDLRGWRRLAFALAIGALSALAFAPFGLFPLLLLAYAALVLLLDGAQSDPHPIRRSAVIGWTFGFGQFLAGLYWVGYAFMVDAAAHAWQLPFVALIFPGGLALFIALACAAYAYTWREGPARIFLFAACYAVSEWLRGNILTGFPWNLAGYGWGASLGVLQSTALFGVYGLTLLTVLFGASLALLCERNSTKRYVIPGALTLLFACLWIGGDIRLAATPANFVSGVHLRIVQPNVPQGEKYLPRLQAAHWRELMDLSLARGRVAPTHIIWPEAAPPFLLARVPQALDGIAILTGRNKVLMTGAVRADRDSDGELVFHNSFYIFGPGGALLATYDKFHLVPLGEYIPFPKTLRALGIDKLVNQPGGFGTGDGLHTYDVPGAPPAAPLICYEILFPGAVSSPIRRAGWFVNVTDDSWFGPPSSTGPYQHFLVARVRAIEEGLPVVRAANTGISAVVDSVGRVVAQLPMDQAAVLDSTLPQALRPTLFARIGQPIFLLLIAACVALGLGLGHRRGRA